MKTTNRMVLRVFTFVLILASVAFSWACIERPMKVAEPTPCVISEFPILLGSIRDVDLIFQIDTSLSMADEQLILRDNFPNLVRVLKDISGGLPNIHMGTITPDLGTSPYNIPGCERPGGDQGAFMKGLNNSCVNPVNQTYVVDIEPKGCNIEKTIVPNVSTTCTAHDCTQANCNASAFEDVGGQPTEPEGLMFAIDDNGCPRCRNYQNEDLEDVFSCMATLGTSGCGMEQQLEAMYQAITGGHQNNRGFLRSNAYLAIFLISDEDDCSTRNTELFNPSGDINSSWGSLTSFRCTEFGVKCDQEWQRTMPDGPVTYTNCLPREANDPKNMLHPISRYTSMLSQLKDSSMLLVGAITGPYTDQLTVGLDKNNNPMLMASCGEHPDGADPAVRILAFVKSLIQKPEDMQWAFTSICADDYSPALVGLGNRIRSLVEVKCITTPLNGCPDPAFANGFPKLTSLPDSEAARCEPLCSVQDVDRNGVITEIPQCNPTYMGGHPALRDKNLPVPRCFHVMFNPDCAVPCPEGSEALGCHVTQNPWHAPSRGAEIIISRRDDPPPGTSAKISCAGLPLTEKLCSDGIDNDMDGLVDMADPDCQ